MKTKLFFNLLLCSITSCLFIGCAMEELTDSEPVQVEESQVFTLNATYGTEDTKVAFDEDGLGLSWQPGDCLYLIDVTGENSTVTMTTPITEPSKSASFRSTSSVLSGDYIVMYGQDSRYVKTSAQMQSTSMIGDEVRLYGSLSVEDGQTSASITLSHVFAMFTFKFANLPALSNMNFGMAVNQEGVVGSGRVIPSGYDRPNADYEKFLKLGWRSGDEARALMLPMDLTGRKVYFYVYGTDSNGDHVTYEFVKDGKELCAGVNYNLTFDFSQSSSVCTLSQNTDSQSYHLTTPAQFRAAAYWDSSVNNYSLESDMDFSGETYFPIRAKVLYGNGFTLSNITADLNKCPYVGVLSQGAVMDLKVKNSMFAGKYNVGSMAGYCTHDTSISGCCADGVNVQGTIYVGGLFGELAPSSEGEYLMSNCSVTGSSAVTGSGSYVGGLVGKNSLNSSSYYNIDKCLAKGTVAVEGGENTGGLVGYSYGTFTQCGFEGSVNGSSYVGGIVGYYNKIDYTACKYAAQESYVKGDVIGTSEYVGGVAGNMPCADSYHIGDTSGTDHVGGINGSVDTYSYDTIYCYSYGTTSSGYGIAPAYVDVNNNLTSSASMGLSSSNDNCNCGPDKTFLSKLSVINVHEAYSTQVWKDVDAQCPLLQWQADALGGDVDIPGFGDEEW